MEKILAQRLKELRAEKRLSQKQIAEILAIAQPTYASWEIGRTEPDTTMIRRLAIFFETTSDYLLGLSNDMYPEEKKPKDSAYIPPQTQMHYVHVPMRGGKDRELYVTDKEFDEMEEILQKGAEKHYRDEQKKRNK